MQPLWREIVVRDQTQVSISRAVAADFSRRLGFPVQKQADIVLSASEMAQNHIKHKTISGRLRFFGQRLAADHSVMSISSLDMGPGIPSIKRAMRDGVSSSKGLGSGLGCIRRVADEFAICSGKFGDSPCPDLLSRETESVTLIAALFRYGSPAGRKSSVDFSYLIRPLHAERYCGDGFYARSDDDCFSIVLIDALGHGHDAAEAVSRAFELLRLIPASIKPYEVLVEMGRALSHSRGLSAQAVRLDMKNKVIDTAAVGNVSQYLYLDGKAQTITGRPGVLGPVTSRSSISEERFSNFRSVLGLLFTDGLDKVPRLKFQQSEMSMSALLWTHYLFPCCNKEKAPQDDATLAVWKWQH